MITSQYGNELKPVVDAGSGEFVGFEAMRICDNERRYYALHQVRADGSIREILAALAGLPVEQYDKHAY